jgi:hypothetical protein
MARTTRGLASIISAQDAMKAGQAKLDAAFPNPDWSKDDLKRIDAWIKGQNDPCDRKTAVRRLVELGLKAKGK